MPEYKTYFWNNIDVEVKDFFAGSTNLLDENGQIVGKLLLSLESSGKIPDRAIKEIFCFIFDDGSLGFSLGLNDATFRNISLGNYGLVSDKSGIYTNIFKMTYFFEYQRDKKMWKIIFSY